MDAMGVWYGARTTVREILAAMRQLFAEPQPGLADRKTVWVEGCARGVRPRRGGVSRGAAREM
jgi:hypothetical protein